MNVAAPVNITSTKIQMMVGYVSMVGASIVPFGLSITTIAKIGRGEMSGKYILLSREAYSDLCLKAAALKDIRLELLEINRRNYGTGFGYGTERALEVIDRHIKGEEKEDADSD